jgi:SWI/SNF-related matrix-associated actin-dependent regulator of chromatin subfamily A3
VRRLANEFDLVVTTYQTLGTDFSRGNNPLAGLDWHRVVLDEAHSIKEMKSNQSKACCALTSNLRWCCTGGLSLRRNAPLDMSASLMANRDTE